MRMQDFGDWSLEEERTTGLDSALLIRWALEWSPGRWTSRIALSAALSFDQMAQFWFWTREGQDSCSFQGSLWNRRAGLIPEFAHRLLSRWVHLLRRWDGDRAQLNVQGDFLILHLVSGKNITFKSSYNRFKYWHSSAAPAADYQLFSHVQSHLNYYIYII